MEDNKDIITLGEWNVPSKWEEVSLKMYSEIERFYEDKDKQFDIRDVLHILTNHSKDEINMLPMDFLERIMGNLAFLQERPKDEEPTNKVVINGETYCINFMEKLKFGEYVSADRVLKGDKHNYAALLTILCRKDGEIYDSKFEAEVFDDRMKMWEEQPITKVLPLVGFFFELYVKSETLSKLYTMVEEALDHTAKSIESSQKIGVWRKLYTKWQMNRLRKLLESSKNTSQTHSHSLLTSLKRGKWKKKKTNGKK